MPVINADLKSDLQLAARLFEVWRLCRKSSCQRARACRGEVRVCCEMLVAWSGTLSSRDKQIGFAEALERLRER